jgi:Zn-finger nucleic acid-binding protein
MMRRDVLLCPVCARKTHTIVREDTALKNFPLFCPKCKHETLVDVLQLNMIVIEEPAARTQKPQTQSQ